MNRTHVHALRWLGPAFAVAVMCSCGALRAQARAAPATPPPPSAKSAPADKPPAKEEENPFAIQPATPLPPGMTGSTTNDPRVGLKPGLYDAGEAAMGIEHLAFVKKPQAFQLSATQPDDPAVQKTLGILGIGDVTKIPKPLQPVIAH